VSNHTFILIEADGVYTQPTEFSQLRINAGQRYSVLVQGSQKPDNYWIQATQDPYGNNPTKNPTVQAILHYTTVPLYSPPISEFPVLNALALQSFKDGFTNGVDPNIYPYSARPPPAATRNLTINMMFVYQANHSQLPFINGQTFKHLTNTTVLNYLLANVTYPISENVQVINTGDVIDILINNYNGDQYQHPMHVHGHRFYVLGKGPNTNPYPDPAYPLNTVNPMYRDTFTIDPSHWAVVRMVADNPGVWLMHCHIDWHLMIGQAWVFIESPDQVIAQYGNNTVLEFCPGSSYSHSHSN